MPFSAQRFNRLIDIKGITQQELANSADVAQSQISDCKKGVCRSTELTEKLARALDCTPNFLLGWGFKGADADDELFRAAVSSMALDAFEERINVGIDQKEHCRKVLRHPAAPLTADGWRILSEHIDLAIGNPPTGNLRVLPGGSA